MRRDKLKDSEALFRKEALEALRVKHYGRPIARLPSLWGVLAVTIATMVAFAAWYLATSNYSRKETVTGWLTPDKGLVRVHAGQYGIVEQVWANEGDHVTQGTPVLVFSSDTSLVGGGQTTELLIKEIDRERDEINRQMELAQDTFSADSESLESTLLRINEEVEILQNQLQEQDRILIIAQNQLDRLSELNKKGAASNVEVERQREVLISHRQSRDSFAQRLQSLLREKQLTADKIDKLPLEKAQTISRLQERLSSLIRQRTELEGRGKQMIKAPVTGAVATLAAKPGSSIDPQRILLEMLPEDSTLYADIYVSSRAIGFVEAGKPVRLMYDAFPHERFGSAKGTIDKVTNTALRSEEIPTPLQMGESAYRARVMLHAKSMDAFGRTFPLRPGMTLRAEIILEERTFLQWLLEPVLARRNVRWFGDKHEATVP